jgi:hypothetical protein
MTLPDPPPILRGREAKAFLEDIAKPPTEKQLKIVARALKEYHDAWERLSAEALENFEKRFR